MQGMLKLFFICVAGFATFAFSSSEHNSGLNSKVDSIYIVLNRAGANLPPETVLKNAFHGFFLISDESRQSNIFSIIDYSKPSSEKRLWIFDLSNGKLLHYTYVAHGKNSGELYAQQFSNVPDSKQSSLGFFRTGSTYNGKHGLSLKLHGLEPGVNDMAEQRAIVIHGAEYVSETYARSFGRLGRSHGCPAISTNEHKQIIENISGGTYLFIYHPSKDYFEKSKLFNAD